MQYVAYFWYRKCVLICRSVQDCDFMLLLLISAFECFCLLRFQDALSPLTHSVCSRAELYIVLVSLKLKIRWFSNPDPSVK